MAPAQRRLVDMHCHLDFSPHARDLVLQAQDVGLGFLSVSCVPAGFERACHELAGTPNAVPALGIHPWWVADGRAGKAESARFEELAPEAAAFGEVGLDFSPKHTAAGSHPAQVEAFELVCAAADASARAAGVQKPLSIHSVRAAGAVLDILEKSGCLDSCACIFHWFSGSTPELRRAREAGCWFSVNPMGLATGKGREYAKLIPADKLLLETDYPEEGDASFSAQKDAELLEQALSLLAAARSEEADALRGQCAANAAALLGW